MEIFLIGLATAFNFGIIVKKLRMGRTADAILDASILAVICFLFSGTYGALSAGAVASALFSIYLLWRPFHLSEVFGATKADSKRPVTNSRRTRRRVLRHKTA